MSRTLSASSSDDTSLLPAAERLAGALHKYERLLRDAFAAGGELAAVAVLAQSNERLSPTTGHQVLGSISAANLSISDALSKAAQGHRLLETLGRQLGFDPVAYGDGVKPPEPTGAATRAPVALVIKG